jgi:tRNA(adenine34) deaminase
VAEGDGLENRCTRKRIGGSNPSLSAIDSTGSLLAEYDEYLLGRDEKQGPERSRGKSLPLRHANGAVMSIDETYMREALALARQAFDEDEVPVGAVVVKDGEIIGRGYNQVEQDNDPTAHAEAIAIRQAAAHLGGWRLTGCDLYVTKEPCPMCAGTIVMSRVSRLIFGAADTKMGYAVTLNNTVRDSRLNHQVEVVSGVMAEESAGLLKEFFAARR